MQSGQALSQWQRGSNQAREGMMLNGTGLAERGISRGVGLRARSFAPPERRLRSGRHPVIDRPYESSCLITVTLLYATWKPSLSAFRCDVVPPCVTTTAYSHPAVIAAVMRARNSAVCRPVLRDYQPGTARDRFAVDRGDEWPGVLHLIQRRYQSAKGRRCAIGKECALDDGSGKVGFAVMRRPDLAVRRRIGKLLLRRQFAIQNVVQFRDRVSSFFEHLKHFRGVQRREVDLGRSLVLAVELLDPTQVFFRQRTVETASGSATDWRT